ncbi:MAG: alpha-amylase/4-alpha-glucanotransferase domain-containing protein [Candidatus Hydrogenedentota bacterium]
MKRINLIFGCHCHQPVGNFGHVFADAYDMAYKPFVDVLEKYPAVKATQHYTGPLFDWFLAHRPEFIERLAALVQRGQVEIMGGAFYEPLLCAIPEQDAIDQIRRMQDFCEQHFGQRPRGAWLTERVWEPAMARVLAKAGVEYTVLDDMHFKASGVRPEDLFGYYATEDEGRSVQVFPIIERLRYTIPFQQVEKSIDYLREHATEAGTRCAVIHDDGEKFGVWPQTHESVYGEGWLEEFFQALTDNQSWIRCLRYKDYMAEEKSLGRTYITCASYREMMGWTLPTPMQRELHDIEREFEHQPHKLLYIRGGFWRNFLAKYPESNGMQKRMLRLSRRLAAMQQKKRRWRKDSRMAEAQRILHESQCNCAYWHGVFGGLYLNHLRTAIFDRIVQADALLDAIAYGGKDKVRCEVTDLDADGHPDIVLENRHMGLYLSPDDGGTLFELDYKPIPFNLINSLARREEVYHDDLRAGNVQLAAEAAETKSIHDIVRVKEEGLENLLIYDPYRRVSLRDHFLEEEVTTEDLWANTFTERGDFAMADYAFEAGKTGVTLSREGRVTVGETVLPVRIAKRIELVKDASVCEIRYDIENRGDVALEALFAVEFTVNVLTGDAPDRYFYSDERTLPVPSTGAMACDEQLRHIGVCDGWKGFACHWSFTQCARIFRFPVETVSQSEGGQERVYQESVLVPAWPVQCAAGESVRLGITMRIDPLEKD